MPEMAEKKFVLLIEKVSRHPAVKTFIYVLAGLYILRLIFIPFPLLGASQLHCLPLYQQIVENPASIGFLIILEDIALTTPEDVRHSLSAARMLLHFAFSLLSTWASHRPGP